MNAVTLYANGLSVRDVAKKLGVRYDQARRLIDRAGVTRNRSEAQLVPVKGGELWFCTSRKTG